MWATGVLREVVVISGGAALGALVPLLAHAHAGARAAPPAPHKPRPRPHLHMTVPPVRRQEAPALAALYRPYHRFIGQSVGTTLLVVAINLWPL